MDKQPALKSKKFHSIGEVAEYFDVNESLLRYWEQEFSIISPQKGRRGIRRYTKEDIEKIHLVYHLVKEKGMTLAGARQKLQQNKELTVSRFDLVKRLKSIKYELEAMRDELDRR